MRLVAMVACFFILGCTSTKKGTFSRTVANTDSQLSEQFRHYCLNFPIEIDDETTSPRRDGESQAREFFFNLEGPEYCELRNYRISELNQLALNLEFKKNICPSYWLAGSSSEDQEKISNSALPSTVHTGAVLTSVKIFCSGGAPR